MNGAGAVSPFGPFCQMDFVLLLPSQDGETEGSAQSPGHQEQAAPLSIC